MSRHQNTGKSHDLMTANKSFEKWQSSNIWERQ